MLQAFFLQVLWQPVFEIGFSTGHFYPQPVHKYVLSDDTLRKTFALVRRHVFYNSTSSYWADSSHRTTIAPAYRPACVCNPWKLSAVSSRIRERALCKAFYSDIDYRSPEVPLRPNEESAMEKFTTSSSSSSSTPSASDDDKKTTLADLLPTNGPLKPKGETSKKRIIIVQAVMEN